MTAGAAVQLYTCGNPVYAKNQVWQLNPIYTTGNNPAYQLVSVYSGECLDVDGVSTQNGAHLQQYSCGSSQSLNQLWTFGLYNGSYQLVSVNSGACLDLPGGNPTPGNQLQQWSCANGYNPNQLWKLVATGTIAQSTTPTVGTPATFFGLTVLNNLATATNPLTFSGTRSQDSYPSLNWVDLEPTRGTYQLANLDSFLTANKARGTSMIYTFGRIPPWASSTPNGTTPNGEAYCGSPANMADWDDFVRTIATHSAGRIRYWEVWNEPQYYYCGTMSSLITMAQHASSIIKSIDPAALILSPSGTTEGGPGMLSSFLAGGGGAYVDVIACHGYHTGLDEVVVPTLQNYKIVMNQYGASSKPLWDTESSWATTTNRTTSAGRVGYLAKSYLLHASTGIDRFYWYGYDSTLEWGSLTNSGVTSPELIAYREIQRWVVGATLSSNCAATADGSWSCSLTRPTTYSARVLWNPGTAVVTYKVPAGFTQSRKLDGTVQTVAAGAVLTLGNQPILLETGSAF